VALRSSFVLAAAQKRFNRLETAAAGLFGFGVECGGALLRRFRLVGLVFALGSPPHSETGKTKAAEQSTAALHTKPQTAET
jgi:hypothetical protein